MGITGDGPCVVDHFGPCGVAGCMSCAAKTYVMRDYPGQKLNDYLGAGAPPHGGGPHSGPHHGGGMHGGGRHPGHGRFFGGRNWFGWPNWWGPEVVVDRASCMWMPPTSRVPPSVIAALARQPFVNGWRYVFDSGWWAEQQSPNAYFVCVVADTVYGLSADVDATSAPAVPSSFPVWPMVAVGVVAVGLFVATLAIKKR